MNELAYGGLVDLEDYLDKRLGVRMFANERQRELLRLFVEVRNINVHNSGAVNEVFASRVGQIKGYTYTIGRVFHVDFDALLALSNNAMNVALAIDSNVGSKFNLKRRSHKGWRSIASRSRRQQRQEANNQEDAGLNGGITAAHHNDSD